MLEVWGGEGVCDEEDTGGDPDKVGVLFELIIEGEE